MERRIYFISHPNVTVSSEVPVPKWPLSERGRERMRIGLSQPWLSEVTAVYCSTERKAQDGAEIICSHVGLPWTCVQNLGEHDRSSTGYLPAEEFERTADEFFAFPSRSVRGWETAHAAQERIVKALGGIIDQDRSKGSIAIVSHGAIGTLLYCHLAGKSISRKFDQPANGGGNYYSIPISSRVPDLHWRPFDALVA